MRFKLKGLIVLLIGVLSLLCFVAVAFLLNMDWMASDFDSGVIRFIQGMEAPWLTVVMKLFTFIGSTEVVIVLSLCTLFILYKFLHHRIELVLFMVINAGNAGLNQVLKAIFHRERPTLHRIIEETGFSFPSGHSMGAFAFYASLAFLLWRHLPTWRSRTAVIVSGICMTLLIGLSRIYLGVHYPSDVAATYFASGFWFSLNVWLFQWFMEYRYNKTKSNDKNSNSTRTS